MWFEGKNHTGSNPCGNQNLFIQFIQFISENKQTSKQRKQASNYRKTDRSVPVPTTTTNRPTDRRRPTDRPTDRPTTDRPTVDDRRRTIDDARFVFLHLDGRLSMSDDRLYIDGRIVLFVHFGAPYKANITTTQVTPAHIQTHTQVQTSKQSSKK